MPGWVRWFITFHVVVLGWIFFRAQGFDAALAYLQAMAHNGVRNTLVTPLSLALIVLGLAIHAMPARLPIWLADRVRRWPAPVVGAAVATLILVIDAMRPEGVAPFIYYQF